MCGIVGLYQTSGLREKSESLGPMLNSIAHRGPDSSGVWQDPEYVCQLGFRRLSIVELSTQGQQPMKSRSGDWVICFNGEIYNHMTLRAALEREGVRTGWRGRSDTESLLEAIAAFGIREALALCDGMFAIAAYHLPTRTLYLARDRFGEKPLYYGLEGNRVVFVSELKALRYCREWDCRESAEAVAAFLDFGYVPGEQAALEGVRRVPPGNILEIRPRGSSLSIERHSFWTYTTANVGEIASFNPNSLTNQVELLLRKSVASRLVADVPVGVFLSGGVDSSAVAAIASRVCESRVKTFSVGFAMRRVNEAPYAEAIAKHIGTQHETVMFTEADMLSTLDTFTRHYDEPFGDLSSLPLIKLCQFASRDVKVVLSGDGGDELFGGYDRYFIAARMWRFGRYCPRIGRCAISTALRALPVRLYNSLIPQHMATRYLRTQNPGDRIHKLAEVLKIRDAAGYYERFIKSDRLRAKRYDGEAVQVMAGIFSAVEDCLSFAGAAAEFDRLYYLPDDILVKLDRATMATSIEGRAPFLDPVLWEFLASIPASSRFSGANQKWVLKEVLTRYIPERLWNRRKMGFEVPFGEWARDKLADWVKDRVFQFLSTVDVTERHWIRRKYIEHMAGTRDWGYFLWKICILQQWRSDSVSNLQSSAR